MKRPKSELIDNHYTDELEKYADYLEKKRKECNSFIKEIAESVGIDTDVVGFDGIQLSIDDFKEAINEKQADIINLLRELRKVYLIDVDENGLKTSINELVDLWERATKALESDTNERMNEILTKKQ